ncbi:helix-turn-helix domain-containing protein, partial [Mycobacterium sp.]|uniref:PucR family transcriptional regulator n=1 Tax=Mycobacterium sp. TaxID=1785 RepID=UPI002D2B77AD
EILDVATSAVGALAPFRVEASYRHDGQSMILSPTSPAEHPGMESVLRRNGWHGQVTLPDRAWAWAFALTHQDIAYGCLVVSAENQPRRNHFLLLTILAQQIGAALACAAMHHRDAVSADLLAAANENLATAVQRLEKRTDVQESLARALTEGRGEQGIADALRELTALSVCVEDKFGNLRCWAGPQRPNSYPKPHPAQRQELLRGLAVQDTSTRIGDRVVVLVRPHAETLAVLALIDPGEQATEDDLFALHYARMVLGLELSHQRNLAEIELNVRREFVDDLLAGTDDDGAYARAEALGHDLRRSHYVVVVQNPGGADASVASAAGHAVTALHLNYLQGRNAGTLVLLLDGRPEPGALHRAISRQLGSEASAIGIGSRCDVPSAFPQGFATARHALNIRLHSAAPAGASAYDELGFYRLVDAAHTAGAVEDFVSEWLGTLLDYDENKNSQLVHTLSSYLECGGNYDESAAALHVHRSTLRYRLARIGELTGYDLRDVDTRFNLHAATRAWRFLNPDG